MARRSDARDKAKAEYIRRRAVGENINLKEFAGEMGANYESLRRWKVKDGWEKDVPRKRGGQPGNTNSRKKKNAKGNKGGGAPRGNKNAEKDGAYSAVFFDALPDADKEFLDQTPTGAVENLLHELKVLRWREKKIIEKIHEYEQVEDEETLYLNGTMMDMEMKDTPFARIQKLQEALYKVQGRATTIAGALRQAEENDRRYKLERERLELARMKATGEVEVDDDDAVCEQGSGPVVGADGETDKADAGCRHYPGSETGAV